MGVNVVGKEECDIEDPAVDVAVIRLRRSVSRMWTWTLSSRMTTAVKVYSARGTTRRKGVSFMVDQLKRQKERRELNCMGAIRYQV